MESLSCLTSYRKKKKKKISNENITFPKYFNNSKWWLVMQISTWIRLRKSCLKTQVRLSFCLFCNSWHVFGITYTKTFQLVTISMCIHMHMFKTSWRNWVALIFCILRATYKVTSCEKCLAYLQLLYGATFNSFPVRSVRPWGFSMAILNGKSGMWDSISKIPTCTAACGSWVLPDERGHRALGRLNLSKT